MNRKQQILNFIRKHLALSLDKGQCLQGCGNRLERGQVNFCGDICRHLYTIRTWGRGRPQEDLAGPLKQSLKIASNAPNAVKAFRKARKQQEVL